MDEGKTTFYLVENPRIKNSRCWYTKEKYPYNDEGGLMWSNFAGGFMPFGEKDKIIETAEAEWFTDLDWTGTFLDDDEDGAGWLSPEGKFYGCPSKQHDLHAHYILKQTVIDLTTKGWVRIEESPNSDPDKYTWFCDRRLTPGQRNWFSRAGYIIDDDD